MNKQVGSTGIPLARATVIQKLLRDLELCLAAGDMIDGSDNDTFELAGTGVIIHKKEMLGVIESRCQSVLEELNKQGVKFIDTDGGA